jgi:hypothetical protein
MSFRSYAQNFEDVMLWRALRHVEHGFYVDVGAGDPTHDSVTKAFYERRWHGMNFEPDEAHCRALLQQRPNDFTTQVAVSREYPLRMLLKGVRWPIHFLKIDTDGQELEVLEGLDVTRHCPWIIVVEAMAPGGQAETHHEWEPLLLTAYHFVYFDGLNRFYVANEHAELDKSFVAPPNVFDDFLVMRAASAQTALLSQELVQMRTELARLHASTSWKLTAPLRMIGGLIDRRSEKSTRFNHQTARSASLSL